MDRAFAWTFPIWLRMSRGSRFAFEMAWFYLWALVPWALYVRFRYRGHVLETILFIILCVGASLWIALAWNKARSRILFENITTQDGSVWLVGWDDKSTQGNRPEFIAWQKMRPETRLHASTREALIARILENRP